MKTIPSLDELTALVECKCALRPNIPLALVRRKEVQPIEAYQETEVAPMIRVLKLTPAQQQEARRGREVRAFVAMVEEQAKDDAWTRLLYGVDGPVSTKRTG